MSIDNDNDNDDDFGGAYNNYNLITVYSLVFFFVYLINSFHRHC